MIPLKYRDVNLFLFLFLLFSHNNWQCGGLLLLGQLNLGMYMKDSHTDVSVLVDRALGGASISDGELEIMLHRYLFVFWIVRQKWPHWINSIFECNFNSVEYLNFFEDLGVQYQFIAQLIKDTRVHTVWVPRMQIHT